MDHGTTGVSFTILPSSNKEDEELATHLKINREDLANGTVSAMEELSKNVELDSIELMVITYAMGDGISAIKPLDKVKSRGIRSISGAGKVTGGGTSVYSEIEKSNIPTLLLPGLHDGCEFLDPRFRSAYSHHASAEKISITYNAYLETGWENMIVADISSNSVTMLVQDGIIVGAIDACLGAMGLIHGPLDLEMLREIDDGNKTANECFSHAGAVKIIDNYDKVSRVKDVFLKKIVNGDDDAILALDTMVMTIAMEIWGLIGISNKIEGIVLTGSMGSMTEPVDCFNRIKKYFDKNMPIISIPSTSGSMGSAQIARDIYNGKKSILGINVE